MATTMTRFRLQFQRMEFHMLDKTVRTWLNAITSKFKEKPELMVDR